MKKLLAKAKSWWRKAKAHELFLERLRAGQVVTAPPGMKFYNHSLRADCAPTEAIRRTLKAELRRLAWPTRNLEVRSHQMLVPGGKESKWETKFFVNLGSFRGLEPSELYFVLRNLPAQCGQMEILRCVSKMEERVEP